MDGCFRAQPHRSRRRLISSACGRLVLADDPPASNRQFFGVRETHQDRQGARNLPGMNNTRNPAQDGESDVDQEVAVAADFEEDSKRRQEECQEVEAHVRGGRRHDGCGLRWRRAEWVSSGRSVRFLSGVAR